MFVVEVYAAVRQLVFIDGDSRCEAARVFALSPETIAKIAPEHQRGTDIW